jgi:hypothetical protein
MRKHSKVAHKRTMITLSLLFLVSAGLVQGQIQDRPKAGPEQKKLEAFAGEWSYEGAVSDTFLGPGGKFAGKMTRRMILDGLFLESRAEDKGVYGGKELVYKSVEMAWFDPIKKTYNTQSFDNDGIVSKGLLTVNGNTWTGTGTAVDSKGKTYTYRYSSTLSPDGKTYAVKNEISTDNGKTWKTYFEETGKKVGQ